MFILVYLSCIFFYLLVLFREVNRDFVNRKFSYQRLFGGWLAGALVLLGLNIEFFQGPFAHGMPSYMEWRVLLISFVDGSIFGFLALLQYRVNRFLAKPDYRMRFVQFLKIASIGAVINIVYLTFPLSSLFGERHTPVLWTIITASAGLSIAQGLGYFFSSGKQSIFSKYLLTTGIVLVMLSVIATTATSYSGLNKMIQNQNTPPAGCWDGIRHVVGPIVREMYRGHRILPATLNELLEMLGPEAEKYFICNYDPQHQISFEYFNPHMLREGIDKFVLLYEKPNNHLYHAGEVNSRTVLFNDGSVMLVPEPEAYELLQKQSNYATGFVWIPSSGEVNSTYTRWKEENIRQAKIRAIPPTILIAALLFLTVNVSAVRRVDYSKASSISLIRL